MAENEESLDDLLDSSPRMSLADPAQIEAAAGLCTTIWNAGAEALGVMLGRGAMYTETEVDFNDPLALVPDDLGECMVSKVEWGGDRQGNFSLVMPTACAKHLVAFMMSTMMGTEIDPEEQLLDDEGLDAYAEAISQFIGSSAQALRQDPGGEVKLSVTENTVVELTQDKIPEVLGEDFHLVARAQLTIEGASPFDVLTVMEQSLTEIMTASQELSSDAESEVAQAIEQREREAGVPADTVNSMQMPVYVNLADREMRFSEIMGLVPGSIIEFRKSSETFLDLCVGHTCIARGEAVIVSEHFGLQVRELAKRK